jgi:hypothetical protein
MWLGRHAGSRSIAPLGIVDVVGEQPEGLVEANVVDGVPVLGSESPVANGSSGQNSCTGFLAIALAGGSINESPSFNAFATG